MPTRTEARARHRRAGFEALWASVEGRESYWEGLARLQFTSSIRARLRATGISQAELASRLGWKPAQVSRALRGGQNLTLRSMVRICRALGLRLDVSAVPEKAPIPRPDGTTATPYSGFDATPDPTLVVAEGVEAVPPPAAAGSRAGRGTSKRRKRVKIQ